MKHIALILLGICIAVCAASAAQLTLTWTDNSNNENGFTVERALGLNATTGFVAVANLPVNAVQFVDTTLADSTAYSYRVCAYNLAGASAFSNTASATTRDPLPATPSGPAATPPPAYIPPIVVTLQAGQSLLVAASL
jgi:hypothetical protein